MASEQREPKGVHVVDGKTRPSTDFARQALAILPGAGKTREQLAKEIGRSVSAIDRFAAGKAPLQVGHDVRKALEKWHQDVSKLPPLDDAAMSDALEEWEEEWIEVGRALHRFNEAVFAKKLVELKKTVDAFSTVQEEMAEIGKITPSNRPIRTR